ncbi:MAG: glutamate--tRNA ligase [Acidobacteria bacterium]|nr:MAG: glutamate--tRNA ligase [Acidobacteriota bacterium]
MANIRVRFAPSPTGYLHVGGARTALYNWLFARRHGGVFVLRIEDTDLDRSKPELVTAILEGLEWLGLHWDEGPIHQSERLDRYRDLAARLERSGHAYPCFCAPEELQAKRARAEAERRAWKYDGTCRNLSQAEQARRRAEGRPAALRFRVPESGETAFDDEVFGRVVLQNSQIEDFVLLRSDGNPTYHLGVVSDDLDLRITHVIRGADHLSNTPKQVLMYRALAAPPPVFAHLPLILGPDRQRLSKRHGATAVGAYREQGVLPEALRNFLALLGWTPPAGADKPDGKEVLTIEEMIATFDLQAVSKSNAVFDLEKLAWMNSVYLRALPRNRLLALAEAELASAGLWREAWADPPAAGPSAGQAQAGSEREAFASTVMLLQSRARTLKDFSGSFRAFFSDQFDYDAEAVKKFWKEPALPGLLRELAARLERVEPFTAQKCEKKLREFAEEKKLKAGVLINAARVALTGQAVAPSLFDVMAVLGRTPTVARLSRAANFLDKT